MKAVTVTIVFLLLGMPAIFAAANYSAQWQKGNAFYEQRQYDSAVACFEQIAALKPQNADVYYNLGNAYYKLNKIAPAVLNYERALKINPDDKSARENLALAQSRIPNHIPEASDIFFMRWWHSITKGTNASMWALMSLSLFIVIVILIALRRLSKSSNIPVQLTGVMWFVFFCVLALALSSATNVTANSGAVVMQPDAPLMNAGLRGKPLALVPEGTPVKINNEAGGWAEVSLPDGRTGWLQLAVMEKI